MANLPVHMSHYDIDTSPDSWQRAVHKRPPNTFRVEQLPPEKHGGSYSFGFRIYPIKGDDISTTTRRTSSGESIVSINEYDIWRKWEDCLWFQDTLEVEYSRAAREKRNRLAAGKGVKKDGIYIHSDQAASWESLPFGPDPNDIARDIHHYIPKLSKKGTVFRASQETIDQRQQELRMMMQALLGNDLPTLIKEIKATRTFTDFFGVWRRDIELASKAASPKKQSTPDRPRSSLSTSILSAFSISPVKSLSPGKGKATEKVQVLSRTPTHSDSSSSEDPFESPRPGRMVDRTQGIRSTRSRASSSASHSSSSLPSTPATMPRQLSPTSRQPAIVSQEVSIKYGHEPNVLGGERSSSILESLPEDRELFASPKSGLDGVPTQRRTGFTASRVNRNARVFPPSNSLQSFELSPRSSSRYSTASLQSTRSSMTIGAVAYLDELGVDYCMPSPTPQPRHHPRASVSSLASVMTDSSVDAVIPRSERPLRPRMDNTRRPLSLPEESGREYEPCSEDDSQPEDPEDILDVYFHDLIRPHSQVPDGFPETPTADRITYHSLLKQSSTTISSYSSYSDRRSSFATSISSGSTSSSGNPMVLFIKAVHEDNIVMFRLPRYATLDELRRKIYDKFIQADKSTICQTFAIALVEQTSTEKMAGGRPRADSLSSVRSAPTKGGALHFISSQDEWDNVVATHGGKMLLRIIGSRE